MTEWIIKIKKLVFCHGHINFLSDRIFTIIYFLRRFHCLQIYELILTPSQLLETIATVIDTPAGAPDNEVDEHINHFNFNTLSPSPPLRGTDPIFVIKSLKYCQ